LRIINCHITDLAAFFTSLERRCLSPYAEAKVTIRFLEHVPIPTRFSKYKLTLPRAYTDIGWVCAALIGPAVFLAVWIYCVVAYGVLFGFFLGWISAFILALVAALGMLYLWPLAAAVSVLYLIYRGFGPHSVLLIYVAAQVGIFAIAILWCWQTIWHMSDRERPAPRVDPNSRSAGGAKDAGSALWPEGNLDQGESESERQTSIGA
jgi:hypothetical protein